MSQEDPRKIKAKAALLAGETIASIASGLGVNRRTIERWADEGGWRELKQAEKVVSINKPRIDEPAKVRPKRPSRGQIDELDLIETALCDVSSAMSTASSEDLRSLGGLATALVKLLEYRRKVQPPTVAELAEQMIGLNVPPNEIVAELKRQWQLRA